jgi:hypothetical protein
MSYAISSSRIEEGLEATTAKKNAGSCSRPTTSSASLARVNQTFASQITSPQVPAAVSFCSSSARPISATMPRDAHRRRLQRLHRRRGGAEPTLKIESATLMCVASAGSAGIV